MRFLIVLLLTSAAGFARAQQAPSPTGTPGAVYYPLNPADINHVELSSGWLTFDAAGRHFSYVAEVTPMGNEAAKVCAAVAVLSELRKASKVTVWATGPEKDSRVTDFRFEYDALKP